MASPESKQVEEGVNIPNNAPAEKKEPHSIFTSKEKLFIVLLASVSATLSPLAANIYFPALPQISTAFHKSTEAINLTITVYLVFQGVSPSFWGPLADIYGRRLITMICLIVYIGACTGLALTLTNAYWLLLVLRCLQSSGSASTVALATGIAADITTRAERGGLIALSFMAPMLGPAFGPVIGGALAQTFTWRGIFWFLVIAAGCVLALVVLVLPETLRALVGNGSIPPSRLRKPLVPIIGKGRIDYSKSHKDFSEGSRPVPKVTIFRLLVSPELHLLYFFCGILFAVFYAVLATISTSFVTIYPNLTQTEIGLCFLTNGFGGFLASITIGRFLNREYNSFKQKAMAGLEKGQDPDPATIPIEKARLRAVPIYVLVFSACTIGYGWALQSKTHLAVPLILQFFIGFSSASVGTSCQTLSLDLFPTYGSSVTAMLNLIRCLLGAAATSAVDPMIKSLREGWTFTILGLIGALAYLLCFVELKLGPRWREARKDTGND